MGHVLFKVEKQLRHSTLLIWSTAWSRTTILVV